MNTLSLFKWTGRFEGISLLLLFFWAMPMKYMAGQPEAVRWVGAIHGGLFVLYMAVAALWGRDRHWGMMVFALCLILSSLPFGTFYFENKFLKERA